MFLNNTELSKECSVVTEWTYWLAARFLEKIRDTPVDSELAERLVGELQLSQSSANYLFNFAELKLSDLCLRSKTRLSSLYFQVQHKVGSRSLYLFLEAIKERLERVYLIVLEERLDSTDTEPCSRTTISLCQLREEIKFCLSSTLHLDTYLEALQNRFDAECSKVPYFAPLLLKKLADEVDIFKSIEQLEKAVGISLNHWTSLTFNQTKILQSQILERLYPISLVVYKQSQQVLSVAPPNLDVVNLDITRQRSRTIRAIV